MIQEMGIFPMSVANNFCDIPLPKYLDSKTVRTLYTKNYTIRSCLWACRVTTFHCQQYGCAGCIPFHHQQ